MSESSNEMLQRARELDSSGRVLEAEDCFLAALRQLPDSTPILESYAEFLNRHGSPQEAFELYARLLKIYRSTGDAERASQCVMAIQDAGKRMGGCGGAVKGKIDALLASESS